MTNTEQADMRLAVCLITADRYEYTKQTVESFNDHNIGLIKRHDIMLLHADDASRDPRIRMCAKQHGFKLIAGTKFGKPHRGGQAMRHDVINAAQTKGATHVLILENDWESVRMLPYDAANFVFRSPNIYCMRLYGRYKERDEEGKGRRACGKTHYGKGSKGTYDPGWTPIIGANEPLEMGDIHWGAPPTITRIPHAVWLHEGTKSEKECRTKCAQLSELTARVIDNVFYHIGAERTAEFKQ